MKTRRLLVSRSVGSVCAAALTCVFLTAGDAQTTGNDGLTFLQPASAAAEHPQERECLPVLDGHGEPVPGLGQNAPSESGKLASAAMERFALSPALFVENRGQFEDPSIPYLHHGRGALVALTDSGPVIQLQRPGASRGMGILPMDSRGMGILPMFPEGELNHGRDARATLDCPSEIRHVPVRFPGAHAVTPRGANPSSSVYHYQRGAPEHWRENVPTFEEVVYPGLYDGIDLKVWGRRDHLKYEFHVVPGADYQQVRVRYEGIRGLSLDADGALLIDLGDGWEPLRDDAPYIYQDIGGERVELPGRFRLLDAYTYTFELLAPCHPAYPLVLDPQVEWGTYLGGNQWEYGNAIALDGDGNIYIAGSTWSSGWVSGGWDTTYDRVSDAFVVKLSAAGAHLWSTYLGGNTSDFGRGIAVDGAGNVYLTGETDSSGWVSGGFDTTYDGNDDGFVVKLSAAGAHLWSTYLGESGSDQGNGIAVDDAGNVYVSGDTYSSGWVSGGYDTTYNSGSDAFVVKLSAAGVHLWSTYLGEGGGDHGHGVAVDGAGNVYASGSSLSSGWVSGGWDTTHNGWNDAFVVKLTAAGAHLWSTYLGGSDDDGGSGIAVDGADNVYVSGNTESDGWVSGGFDTTYSNEEDAFVVKLSAAGAHLWSTYLGLGSDDEGRGIVVDGAGNVYVTGETSSVGWVSGGWDTTHNGQSDAFLVKLSASGAHLWSTYLGGRERDEGRGIAVGGEGNVYTTGTTASAGWVSRGFDTTYNGGYGDAFVVKIRDEGEVQCSRGGPYEVGDSVCFCIPHPSPSDVQWYHDGMPLAGENARVLCLFNLRVEDSGVYRAAYDDGTAAPAEYVVYLLVGENVPAAGAGALVILIAASGVAGVALLRKRPRT